MCSLHDNESLRPDASNLAAFLYRMIEEHDFVLKLQKLPTEEEQIRLLWRQKDSDYVLWPSQLSDGSIRFICLTTALLQPYSLPRSLLMNMNLAYILTLLPCWHLYYDLHPSECKSLFQHNRCLRFFATFG